MRAAVFIRLLCIATNAWITVSATPLKARQDPASISSSSSYDYWWPYPPGGIYATTSTSSFNTPTSTTAYYTPSSPVVPTLQLPTDSLSGAMSMTSETSSVSSDSCLSDSGTATSTDSTKSLQTSIRSETSSPIPSRSAEASKDAEHHPVAYLAPLLAILGLSVGIGIGILLHRRSSRGEGTLFSLLEKGGPPDGTTGSRWASLQALFGRSFRSGPRYVHQQPRLGRAPPVTLRDIVEEKDFDDEEVDLIDYTTYGYGQWRDRSVQRHLRPDLTRAYSNEGDAEEVVIDLSKGWKHFTSIRREEPQNLPRSLLRTTPVNDKFTSLPVRKSSSAEERGAAASSTYPTRPTKYKSLFRIPFLGRSKSSDESSPSGLPNSSVAQNMSGSASPHRSSVHAATTTIGYADDDQAFLSSPYSETPNTQFSPAFPQTPRHPDGEIRHKSIRRVLAERLHPSGPGNTGSARTTTLMESDQMSLNDLPPSPEPLRVVKKHSRGESVKEMQEELERDVFADPMTLATNPTRYRRTQQALKDEPESSSRMDRIGTGISTIPSIYSPSPANTPMGRSKSMKKSGSMGSPDHSTSAAELARNSRRKRAVPQDNNTTATEENANYHNEYPFPTAQLHRAQSPLPDLPSGIMSPPLEAAFFFSPEPASPPAVTSKGGARWLTAPPDDQNLSRNSSVASAAPPSHFTAQTRAQANAKVDMIVKQSYSHRDLGFSPVPLEVEESFHDGIEQRLALLRRLG